MTAIKRTRINNALPYETVIILLVMMLSISWKRLIAFIVTEVIKSKQEFDARLIDIELAFLFDSMSMINRTPRLLRPKTMTYWTDIFPYLNDESEYNNNSFNLIFAFCDLRSIDCSVSYSNILTIYPHPSTSNSY